MTNSKINLDELIDLPIGPIVIHYKNGTDEVADRCVAASKRDILKAALPILKEVVENDLNIGEMRFFRYLNALIYEKDTKD